MNTSPVFEELERRILYSADFAPLALAAGSVEQRLLTADATHGDTTQATHEIAFVDMSLPDANALVADLESQAASGRPIEVVRIAADEDGIARIGETLAGRGDISAVHVLSHGADGVLQLGAARLDAASLVARAGEVASWSAALTNEADLLLYGCDVAQTARGAQFVDNLALLTGADVAASTDLTGAAAQGGDWTLEARSGVIEASVGVTAQAQASWSQVMAIGIDQTSTSKTSGSSLTISHTTSGSQTLMLVAVSMADHGSNTVASITYDGVALTQVGVKSSLLGDAYVELWQLVAPSAGSHDVLIDLSGANAGGTVAGVMTFSGVDQTTPTAGFTSASGSAVLSASLNVASAGGQLVFGAIAVRDGLLGGNLSAGAGQTERWEAAQGNLTAGATTEAGAASVAMSWGVPLLDSWSIAALSIRAASNTPPVITSDGSGASAAVNVAENTTAATTVVATDAQTPGTLAYAIVGGADAAKFTIDATSGALAFVAAPDFEAPTDSGGNNVYGVIVQVSDGSLADTQSIAVAVSNVNDNVPVITSDGGGASAAVSAAENSIAVTAVVASDGDTGASLAYAIVGGADAAAFTINAASGVLNFKNAPDFEAPGDAGADNIYDVLVQASDGTFVDQQSIAVTVTDQNDNAPGITLNRLVITEGGSAAPSIATVDPDNTPAQLAFTVSGLSGGRFEFTGAPGVAITSFTQADVNGALVRFVSDGGEAAPAYRLTVSDGATSVGPQAANVTYTRVDDAPAITANSLSVVEGGSAVPTIDASDPDSARAQLAYAVSGLSGGRFELTSAPGSAITSFTQAQVDVGLVRFVSDGGEAAPAYQLSLSDGTTPIGPQAASVSYTNVNDAPVVSPIALGTIVEDGSRLITQAQLLSSASDAEGDALTAINLALASDSGALTNNGDGTWTFAAAANWNGSVALNFDVSDGGTTTPNGASLAVNVVNDAPLVTSNGGAPNASLAVAENTTAVATVTASDVDTPTSALRFAIVGGSDAARFTIDAASGALAFAAAPDHENPTDANGDNRYEVIVGVSDGSLSAQQSLAIDVSNIDEAPVFTSNALILSSGNATLVLRGSDPDTATAALVFQVSNAKGGHFESTATPGSAITSFAQGDIDAGTVRFVADAASTAPSYVLTLSDGVSTVSSAPLVTYIPAPALAPAPALPPVTAPPVVAPAPVVTGPVAPSATPPASLVASPNVLAFAPSGAGNAAMPTDGDAAQATTSPAAASLAYTPLTTPSPSHGLDAPTPNELLRFEIGGSSNVGARFGDNAQAATRHRADIELARGFEPQAATTPTLEPLRTVALDASGRSAAERGLAQELDRLREQLAQRQRFEQELIASGATFASGLTVGYVLWLARGGVLVASLLSSLPAWSMLDPLPVLAAAKKRDDDDAAEETDPIEKLFGKARRWLSSGKAMEQPA